MEALPGPNKSDLYDDFKSDLKIAELTEVPLPLPLFYMLYIY